LLAFAASYVKRLKVSLGFVVDFHELKLVDGVSKLLLPGAKRI
jgi:hypothetical protein